MKKNPSAHRCTGLTFYAGFGAGTREPSAAEIALAAKPWTFSVMVAKEGVNLFFSIEEKAGKYDKSLIKAHLSIIANPSGHSFHWNINADRDGTDHGINPHTGHAADLNTAYAAMMAELAIVRALPILTYREIAPLVRARQEAERLALEAQALDPSQSEMMRSHYAESYRRDYGHDAGTSRASIIEERRKKDEARALDPKNSDFMRELLFDLYRDEFGHEPGTPRDGRIAA